jgi:small subunit ribosomal protein S4
MVRYIGPKVRILRRLGVLPGLTRKKARRGVVTSPGQHGKVVLRKSKRSFLSGDYKERLIQKQKLRYNYGITEKQLFSYYNKAKEKKGVTGNILLALLEGRLDCIVYRLGFAPSIPAARQYINHRHIFVNKKLVTIPSFLCFKNDIISIQKEVSKKLIEKEFQSQQEKRKLILRRLSQLKLAKSRFYSLLPTHLKILNEEQLEAKMVDAIQRKNVSLRIKELKVVEYYSR